MYSFEPSDEQRMIIDAARKFASKELRSHFREADEKTQLPAELTRAGWELGLLPASIPEQYGGFGEHSAANRRPGRRRSLPGGISPALLP